MMLFTAFLSTSTPVLTANTDVKFPDNMSEGLVRFTLDNGMTVLLRAERAAPVASIQFWVGVGSAHEQELLGAGLSHLIEHMIFKGTPTRGPAEISRAITDIGGNINAYTSLERTVFFVDLPAANWRVGFEVLADAVQNAAFPEDEWRREKEVIIREMAMYRDSPDSEVSRMLLETSFRAHPYRIPVIGYEDIFTNLTREDMLAFFQRHYTPDNMILSIAGDIDITEAADVIRATFKDFARRPRATYALPREPAQITSRSTRQTGPHQVGRLAQAWHAVSVSHPDSPALDMLATITGNGRSARLVDRIVEREKLAHTIDAWLFAPAEPGLFGITAVFDPVNEEALCRAIDDEIAAWQTRPFTTGEVEKARRILINRVIQEWQTAHGQASVLASGEYYAGTPLFTQTYIKRLKQVTPDDITRVASRYLTSHGVTRALLMPGAGADEETKDASDAHTQAGLPTKTLLSNGLTVLTLETQRLPLVNICIAFNGGIRYETAENNGITAMMAELMTRGAAKRTAAQVAELVDGHGGVFTAFAGQNSFGLQLQCLAEDVELFMELLAESLTQPTFDAVEVEKRRVIQLAQIAQQQESPVFLAQRELRQMLFPSHPYRFTPEGQPETVNRITAGDLKNYHARMVTAANAVMAIYGDIATDRATALAEKHLRRFNPDPAAAHERPIPDAASRINLPAKHTQTAPKEQTILMLGFPGLTLADPRTEAANILQTILSGLASDLMINIRDKEGLAYFTGALNRPGVEPGFFAVYAGIHHQALERVKTLIKAELQRLSAEGVRPEELQRAREQIISRSLHDRQINATLAQECVLNELYGLGYDYGFNIEQRLQNIQPADLTAVAASIFTLERAAVSIVLPEEANN